MDILIDTNIIIMAAKDELPEDARTVIEDRDNRLFFSIASYWEIAIKYANGKLPLPVKPRILIDRLKQSGYQAIDIREKHVYMLGNLAGIHKDPFDRIMVAQAACEDMVFLTTDRLLAGYGQNIMVV